MDYDKHVYFILLYLYIWKRELPGAIQNIWAPHKICDIFYMGAWELVTGKPLVSSMSSHVFRMGFGAPLVTNMGGHGAFRSPMYFVWGHHTFPRRPEGSMSSHT